MMRKFIGQGDGCVPTSPLSFVYIPGEKEEDILRDMRSSSFSFQGAQSHLRQKSRGYQGPTDQSLRQSVVKREDFSDDENQPLSYPFNPDNFVFNQEIPDVPGRAHPSRPSAHYNLDTWQTWTKTEKFFKIMQKFPKMQFLAFLMCFSFGIVFSVQSHFAWFEIIATLQEVMHISYYGIETAEIVSTTLGCLIAAFSLVILLVSIVTSFYGLTSGTHRVASSSPPLVMLILLYPATIIWGCIFAGTVAISTLMMLTEGVCLTEEMSAIWQQIGIQTSSTVCATEMDVHSNRRCVQCIDFYPFHFLFPDGTRREDMEICGREIWMLCSNHLPTVVTASFWCALSSALVLVGVCLHLTVLAHHRASLHQQQPLKRRK